MRVYHKSLEMNRKLAKVAPAIARFDRDLFRQLRRASMSVPLNIGEGLGQRAGHREERFHSALASAREVRACLDSAAAWGCKAGEDGEVLLVVEQTIGMLNNLVRAR
jgi:four helix bundle protein